MAISEAELTALYRSEFGRQPDPEGFDYWMQSDLTPEQIQASFQAGREGQAHQAFTGDPDAPAATEQEIRNLYGLEFGRREVDPEGMEYWKESGWSYDKLQQHFDTLTVEDTPLAREKNILDLYRFELGRTGSEVDQEGLSYWIEHDWSRDQIQEHFKSLEVFDPDTIVWDEGQSNLLRLKYDPVGGVTTGEGYAEQSYWIQDVETAYGSDWTEADKLLDIKQTLGMGTVYGKEGIVGGTVGAPGIDNAYDFSNIPGLDVVGGYPSLNIDWTPGTKIADWDVGGPTIYGQVQRPDILDFVNDPLEEGARRWDIDTETNVGGVVADYLDTGAGFSEFREELPGGAYFESGLISPKREAWLQTPRGRGETPSTTRGQVGVIEPETFGRKQDRTKQQKSGFRRPTTGAQI